MATFTITSSINIDALTGKTGGDTYNLNGGYLTIDQDSRYGQNATTSTTIGPFTGSASLGGTVLIDGTNIRLIPYNTGAGNVPSYNTTISISGASGLMIGVYSNLTVAPTTPGSAMPASGFIKIKQWNGISYSAGALSGISANCTGADVAGWIEIVGDNFAGMIINRLNNCIITGSYYQIGTTDGNRATTYQIPSNGTLQYHPAVEVETSVGSGLYEIYPCAGSLTALAANIATDATRGKVCWIDTTGLLRFGDDGTNSTGGYIPPTGLKIRIPNVFLANCLTTARTANVVPNATVTTRFEFATTGGGFISINGASCSWYLNFIQPYSISLNNIHTFSSINLQECASFISWNNISVGQVVATTNDSLVINYCPQGGTISNSVFTRAALATAVHIVQIQNSTNFTLSNCIAKTLVKAANVGASAFYVNLSNNIVFNNCTLGGARLGVATSNNITANDSIYYDHPATTTTTAIAMYAFEVSAGSNNCIFNGLSFSGLFMNSPYGGILSVLAANCRNIKLRNIGTYNSPLSLGGNVVKDTSWSRVTTTITVTSSNHGLKVGDNFYVKQTTNSSAITIGAKTVVSVIDANTFTFTGVSSGTTSGTLTYYPMVSASILVIASAAAADTIIIQRCYCLYNRSSLFSGDNSSKNITFESVFSQYLISFLTPMNNLLAKGVAGTPALTAQTSCYGTNFITSFQEEIPQNLSVQSWSRASTTCTVTSNDHRLTTGKSIVVTTTSSSAAVILGIKSVTVIDNNTFTFTCLNAGDTSGTITYELVENYLTIMMNESNADTVDNYTIDGGTTAFTSAGGLYMPTINDQITFVMPYYEKNLLRFTPAEAIMAGGTITNYDITYAIDTGSGYSSFKNLSYPRAGGGGSNGSTTVTMTDTTGVAVGDYVFGTNIGGTPTVVSIDSATNITVSSANIGTVSGILRFNKLPSEETLPSTGFKLKIRIKTSTTNATAITSLRIRAVSDDTTRARQYPLDQYNLSFTGLKNPSEVRIFDSSNPTIEIAGSESITSGEYTALIDPIEYPNVIAAILSLGYQNIRLTNIDMSEGDVSIPVQQQVDRQYENL